MIDPDDLAWTAGSRRLDAFRCDSLFAVRTAIQFCDEATGRILPEATVALPQPGIPLIATEYAAASALLGRTDEIVRHYRRVVAAYADRGRLRDLGGRSVPFWVRPAVVAGTEVVTSLVWYDTVPEATAFLQALAEAAAGVDGEVWDDQDQGWSIRVARLGPVTYLTEWDGEGAVPPGFAFDAAALAREADAALRQLRTLHGRLVAELGCDFWSYGPRA